MLEAADGAQRGAILRSVDPVTAAVIGGALDSVALEMGYRLTRTAYSSLIRESNDFGCALCDDNRDMLCQSSQSTPLQSGPIPGYLRGIDRRFGELGDEWRPGDVVVHNHPYYGASHQPDVAFCVPVFIGGELVGFSVTTAHHLDLGALTPGTVGIVNATDAFAEGLLLNAVKVEEGGEPVPGAWRMIADNSRVPDLVIGDMRAQVDVAKMGAARFEALSDEYGLGTLRAAARQLMSHSEKMLRRQIGELPDGRYEAEGILDGFLEHPDPSYRELAIKVAVEIDGEDLHVDLSGTAPQVGLPINMPFVGTVDIAVYMTVRSLLLDSDRHDAVASNSGLYRPIRITAPEGCLANPRFPAPTLARFYAGNVVADTLMRALAPVIPEQVAAGTGNLKAVGFAGGRDGKAWVLVDILEGSYGGRHGKDGLDAVDTLYANTRNQPIEDIESHYPMRIQRYELVDAGAGAGRWRGGVGSVRDCEFLEDASFSLEGDGNLAPPPGLFGGGPGSPGSVVLNPGREDEEQLPSKIAGRATRKGDVLRLVGPCGGGYGDPAERDPEARRRDEEDGISLRTP